METLPEKIARVTAESVEIVNYDSNWLQLFEQEKKHLQADLPEDLIIRIEHFGSTAVPGLLAKPIVDMLIEITDVERGKELIPEILEPQGYDCFWRPLGNENIPPYYTWCIRRDSSGKRTHHLHFVKEHFKDEELRFRNILRTNNTVATEYARLKLELSDKHQYNRIDYTLAKSDFIKQVLKEH
ncbi:MAG: GrpB family protein [Victivallales bacterium]|nr:GrpB family protein [Victivallales bacterium]